MDTPLAREQFRLATVRGAVVTVELIRPALSEPDTWICWVYPERNLYMVVAVSRGINGPLTDFRQAPGPEWSNRPGG
jgi:hypothetical protein